MGMQPRNNITWSQLIKSDTRGEPAVHRESGLTTIDQKKKKKQKVQTSANSEQCLKLAVSSYLSLTSEENLHVLHLDLNASVF